MKFTTESNYQPGHIEMFYGQGLKELGRLEPKIPKNGNRRATFTVNGEWRFRLNKDDESTLLDINNPEELTPELETFIKNNGQFDDAKFTMTCVDGTQEKLSIEWINNNWFEVFVDIYEGGKWIEESYDVDESYNVGPSPENMKKTLEKYVNLKKNNN